MIKYLIISFIRCFLPQDYSSPDVVQSMTNLSIGTSAVEGGVGNGSNGTLWERPTGAQLYQMEHSTTSSRYRKMFIAGNSFGEASCNGRSPGHSKGQAEHYPNAYTTPDAMYMYGPKQYPMDPNQLQSPNLQALDLYSHPGDRRLSDSAYSRNFTKAEADSFREDQLKAVQSVGSSPKGYSNSNCQCANCLSRNGAVNGGKPHRPKVSFGPSMMYPMSPYDANYPGGSFGGGGSANDLNDPKSKANAPPWSKLTTELLPLDTQIPLQMMSDNALVCNIL